MRQLALVVVENVRRSEASISSKAVLRHFKLTPAEERLCELLVNDLTLTECADHLGTSVETVRTQAKAIFRKTGTSRQSELISLLLRAR